MWLAHGSRHGCRTGGCCLDPRESIESNGVVDAVKLQYSLRRILPGPWYALSCLDPYFQYSHDDPACMAPHIEAHSPAVGIGLQPMQWSSPSPRAIGRIPPCPRCWPGSRPVSKPAAHACSSDCSIGYALFSLQYMLALPVPCIYG
jgi:hypothetical protein